MSKPKLLDLFCKAGGASMGYYRAGFDVTGVDIEPQPHYPFKFIQADAMTFDLAGYDVIHASPPCQGYSIMHNLPWLKDKVYPMLINPIRERLKESGAAWIIENVRGANLEAGWLCGTMFGMPFYRHRLFETSFFWLQPGHPKHEIVFRHGRMLGRRGDIAVKAIAEGMDWMNPQELSQSIPPVYTEFIGKHLILHLTKQS